MHIRLGFACCSTYLALIGHFHRFADWSDGASRLPITFVLLGGLRLAEEQGGVVAASAYQGVDWGLHRRCFDDLVGPITCSSGMASG